MAEEKVEKKKPGIVRRILKWIGLGVLSALIILGLIFEAPWKVITLLLIVLAACTILPKQLRKWFWAGVGAVVIALIVWVFLPQETEGWRPYTFDEELAALQAKYAVPDEENAAIIYNRLLEQEQQEDQNEPNIPDEYFDLVRSGPWLDQDYPEVAQWLGQQEDKIATLMRACQFEKCSFPINADLVSFGGTMDRLVPMRKWAYLLISAANNDIAEGRTEGGLEKYIAVLQMSKHLHQQPTSLDMMVGIAIEALALRQFNRFIVTGDATDEYLIVIEKALGAIKYDWRSDFPRFMEHEKLYAKNFWGMFYGVNPEGKIKLTRGLSNAIMAQLPEDMKDELVITYWHERLMKVWSLLCWFYMPSTPQKAGDIIDTVHERFYAMAEPDYDRQKESEKPSKMFQLNYQYLVEYSTEILAPAYHRIHDLYLRLMTDKKGSRIIIALKQYKNQNGFWPVNLDGVKSMAPAEIFVDPTNGGDFVYEITEENFRLYSKGKNNIDEDGKYKRRYGETSEGDDWLIWPPKSRKAKEEGTNAEQQ